MAMAPTTTPTIGVILCSSREPRVCPQIADFVIRTIKSQEPNTTLESSKPGLHLIDLSTNPLPLFNEPTIPSQIKHHSQYIQPHTQAWSIEIQKYTGFIFILPQYNWGYPAVIKNAIDYLFNEWHGKPAMIVSYGGHGGVKAGAQFKQVLQGVRMNVVETMPALSFPDRKVLEKATKGEELGVIGEGGIWDAEREVIGKATEELMVLVNQASTSKE